MADATVLPRVLFVDDEADVLAGLRTSLRRDRTRFDFDFCSSGREALDRMGEQPYDVVVSDVRMPGMTGVELLGEVARRQPDTVRVVLSGEAGSDLVMAAMNVSHRWLSKPCERDRLLDTLGGALRYRELMTAPELREAIGAAAALPTPPRLYQQMTAMVAEPSTSVEDLAEVAASDPAVAAKVLQLANSAFSMGAAVSDLDAAIVRIGIKNLAQLVLSVEVLNAWDDDMVIPGMTLDANMAITTAAAEHAASMANRADAATAAVAALLHHVGLLLEAATLPDRLQAAYDHAVEHELPLVQAERTLYGLAHPDLAAHLLSIWGLPADLVFAVFRSHLPAVEDEAPVPLDDAVRLGVIAAHAAIDHPAVGAPHRFDVGPDTAEEVVT